ncbi:MAG: type III polyketide synthase [Rhodospirillaceae bacterium]|nr:type III polyketide synthase [Rhodospirillaceae bacterium]MDD9925794.1 type III polyketide synthase [Rhodospirillaceae bacterium]
MTMYRASSPRLRALATAVPPFALNQGDVEEAGRRIFAGRSHAFERMRSIYANSGIETRYSCVGLDWYFEDHGWRDRNTLYLDNAVALIKKAALECLERAELDPSEVDGIAVVSTTGIATPSLDALLLEEIPFRRTVQRLPIFGLGCAGGVLGLNRVADLARAKPGSRWLFIVVELCGLTFRSRDLSKSNIVATALFGDGAAAMLVESVEGDGTAINGATEHTWPDSLDVMGWRLQEDGFGVLFSRDIPELVLNKLPPVLDQFLSEQKLDLTAIDHFVPHPGGAKVLDALSDSLKLPQGALQHATDVLRDYGNMSAATVFFVLDRCLSAGARGRLLLSALGPGFTAGFSILEQPS